MGKLLNIIDFKKRKGIPLNRMETACHQKSIPLAGTRIPPTIVKDSIEKRMIELAEKTFNNVFFGEKLFKGEDKDEI